MQSFCLEYFNSLDDSRDDEETHARKKLDVKNEEKVDKVWYVSKSGLYFLTLSSGNQLNYQKMFCMNSTSQQNFLCL